MVTTVFVADDHPLLLHGLTDLIARDLDFLVVGSAQDGTAAKIAHGDSSPEKGR